MRKAPYEEIVERLSKEIPDGLLGFLPRKWEKLGDVLILKFPKELEPYKSRVAEVYADILKCRSVLEDAGGIGGEFRIPRLRFVCGDRDTETVHIENGIRFKLDPMRIMFSSGNKDERIRMARISSEDEIVVDMFAGIGYFSIPMAVYSKPRKIYAIEKNPIAFGYLEDNIALNHVVDIVEPILGDNREKTPKGIADRVVMGYLKDTHLFLPYAIDSLKEEGGIIHYHELCPDELFPRRPVRRLKEAVRSHGKEMEILGMRKVKSYAPGIFHIVVDARIG